ncbi:MAG TPA: hypothetical protein PLK12_16945, partial [Prolixibacteraceae bacterium]|nr:hypothetical protein [Prolixibacteraceae bacterium]
MFAFAFGYSQTTEIIQKAKNLATQYEATGISPAEALAAENLLVASFIDIANSNPVSPATQAQVNVIWEAIRTGASLSATTVPGTISGELSSTDPTYNRVWDTHLNINCITQGTLSSAGSNVFYDVIEFSVTHAGYVDIEATSFPGDSYLSIYCTFDPLNPSDNLIWTNDDGSSLLSLLNNMLLPVGTYYVEMTSFANGIEGEYTLEFRSDDGIVAVGSSTVPVPTGWIVGLFVLLAAGV